MLTLLVGAINITMSPEDIKYLDESYKAKAYANH